MITANFKYCEKDTECFDHNVYKITSYIDLIDLKLSEVNSVDVQKTKWGYSARDFDKYLKQDLLVYKKFLETFQSNLYYNPELEFEISSHEIQKVLEAVSHLIDVNKRDYCTSLKVKIDKSKQQEYLIKNPGCQPYEDWEKYMLGICVIIGLKAKNVTDSVQLVANIVSKSLEDNCKFFTTLEVITKACEQNSFDVNIKNFASCKLQYETLVKNHVCALSFLEYMDVLNSNVSGKAVESIYESGGELKYENDTLYVILNGQRYDLLGLTINPQNSSAPYTDDYILSVVEQGETDAVEVKEILKNSYSNLDC